MLARILNIIMLKQMWYVLGVIKGNKRTKNFNIYIATTGFDFSRFITAVVFCYKSKSKQKYTVYFKQSIVHV